MHTRTLGNTGTAISEVGLGTWQLGSADWGKVNPADTQAILARSVECGVNFIDTADVYGMGHSERAIGDFLKSTSAELHVATKLGRRHDEPHGWPQNFTLETMRAHTEDSLRHLGVDSLFLTQLHCIPTDELRLGEVFEHLRTLQSEGLIQHWGVSVETVEEGLLCLEQPGLASLQIIFNIFRQKLVDELLPAAQAKGVGLIARVPLASGLLAGKFTADSTFAETDHRHYNAEGQCFNIGETFAGVGLAHGTTLAEAVRDTLPGPAEHTMAQQALRWILDHDAITTVIPGATRLAQAESNATVSEMNSLPEETHTKLHALYDDQIANKIQGAY
jgi:aryl-alcohol dehydrogenase-like predicted oxidoreductase